MPILRPALAALVAVCAALPASAQSPVPFDTVVPPALLDRLVYEETGPDDAVTVDEMAPHVAVYDRRDLDGDGTEELFLTGAGIYFCGATGNCAFWIYTPVPGGGWRRLHGGAGLSLDLLEERTNGFPDLLQPAHFSAAEHVHTRYAFDGDRYAWEETRMMVWDGPDDEEPREAYRVSSPVPERAPGSEPEPRAVTLGEVPLEDGAVSVSADYAACAPAAATPGVLCGQPRLLLVARGAAPWAGGDGCFTLFRVEWDEERIPSGEPLCVQGGRAGGFVALHPTAQQWMDIHDAQALELRAGTATVALGPAPTDALRTFADHVFMMNGINPYADEDR